MVKHKKEKIEIIGRKMEKRKRTGERKRKAGKVEIFITL